MTRRPVSGPLRSVASVPAALSVFALVVLVALTGAPISAPPAASALTAREASQAGAIPDPAPPLARIAIDSVTPEVVDGRGGAGSQSGVPTVTVTGAVTNVGPTALTGVDVRLQRGPRIADPRSLRDPLVWGEPSFQLTGPFHRITDALPAGASTTFRVSMPVAPVPGSPAQADLQLTEPGVYPLLVNVNGTPRGGEAARLDDARTLLPVLETPWTLGPASRTGSGAQETNARPGPPPLTVVLPLASTGIRRVHSPGTDGPDPAVVLRDDTLPREIAQGGRLSGLLDAAEETFRGAGGAELREATCLGVDPALLSSVDALAAGTRVVLDQGERSAAVRDAPAAATRWLARLRDLAADHCVVALPAAQADLDAVARVGEPAFTRSALDGEAEVRRVLGVDTLPRVVLPPSGALDTETTTVLGLRDSTVVVAASSTRTDTGLVPDAGSVRLVDPDTVNALTFDSALGAALAATGTVPENPRYSDPSTRYWLDSDSAAARLQDARAALVSPALAPASSPSGALVVPPAVWTVDGPSATSLLRTLAGLLAAGRYVAHPLEARLATPPTVPAGRLADDPSGGADPGRVGADTVGAVRDAVAGIATLRSLVDTADPLARTANAHLDPLTGEALRVLSVTGRRAGGDGVTLDDETGRTDRDVASADATTLAGAVRRALGQVDLLPPGSVFTMASPNSPLLLVARNGLPFPVLVSLHVDAPPDLTIGDVGDVGIPGSGSRTVQLPTESHDDSVRRTVLLSLDTTAGRRVSAPVEISVQTGGYPLALAFTLGAAALALALGLRRYLRYRRGTPDPSDEGHRP